MNAVFIEEEDDKLRLDVKCKLLYFTMVDLIQSQKVVVVVNGVECIYELIDISVGKVEFEGREDVEIGPGVEVEADLELLLVDDALLVEEVQQSVEYLQLQQLETQIVAYNSPLSDALIATLYFPQVLP